VPVLLIAANRPIHPELGHPPGELLLAKAYARRIGPKATLWYLSDVGHNEALQVHPEAYAAQVTAFLASALSS
jgi:hypothetical protein